MSLSVIEKMDVQAKIFTLYTELENADLMTKLAIQSQLIEQYSLLGLEGEGISQNPTNVNQNEPEVNLNKPESNEIAPKVNEIEPKVSSEAPAIEPVINPTQESAMPLYERFLAGEFKYAPSSEFIQILRDLEPVVGSALTLNQVIENSNEWWSLTGVKEQEEMDRLNEVA